MKDAQPDNSTIDAHRIEGLERQLKEKDVLIEQLLEQINQMKTSFHAWVDRTETHANTIGSDDNTLNTENGDDAGEQSHVAKIPIRDDDSYFMTYAHFDIHYDMLSVSIIRLTHRQEK